MTIISWNINGLRAIIKKDFLENIKEMNPDILCLQETRATAESVLKSLSPLSYPHLFTNTADKKGYSGTALLCHNKPISITSGMGMSPHDKEGRLQCAEYQNFYLVHVYAPNSGEKLKRLSYRKKWDSDFLNYVKRLENTKPVILAGDFNVAHQPIDLKNDIANYNKTAGYTQIEIEGMNALIRAGFVDSFRALHPNKIAYTFWNYRFKAREKNMGWRIDYFLISTSLVKNLQESNILTDYYGSDHCPILLKIRP